jgi:hypothetical protein
MAFGKKKDDGAKGQAAEVTEADDDATAELDAVEPESDAVPPVEAVAADDAPAAGAAAPAADPLAGGDALLNMFSTSQIETIDNSTLVDMVGDVEIDDLLETLHIVAAAMGIVAAEETYAQAA